MSGAPAHFITFSSVVSPLETRARLQPLLKALERGRPTVTVAQPRLCPSQIPAAAPVGKVSLRGKPAPEGKASCLRGKPEVTAEAERRVSEGCPRLKDICCSGPLPEDYRLSRTFEGEIQARRRLHGSRGVPSSSWTGRSRLQSCVTTSPRLKFRDRITTDVRVNEQWLVIGPDGSLDR